MKNKLEKKREGKMQSAGKARDTKTARVEKPETFRKNMWIWKAILGGLFGFLIGAYIVVAVFYKQHFFPGTVVNGLDYSNGKTADVMIVMLTQLRGYSLELIGWDASRGEKCVLANIDAQDVDLRTTVNESDVEKILDDQREWLWPVMLWNKSYEYSLHGDSTINDDKVKAFLDEVPAFQEQYMQPSRDAYFKGYSEEDKCFVLEPEVVGTQVDTAAVAEIVINAMREGRKSLDLDAEGLYMRPEVTTEDADLQERLQQANQLLKTNITYDWNANKVVLDGERIKDWLVVEDGTVILDEEAVAEFVAENAKKYDTYGKNRDFITSLGITLTLPSGSFGWKTDREAETAALIELIREGTVGDREPIYAHKAPRKGVNDIGNTYVEADMTNQHLYLYQEGQVVLETDFVSGNMSDGHTTPPGVFGLTYKTMNVVLRGRDYESPVTYWMPFQGNYGMHDSTWRDAYGGDIYLTDGSHGCLNLPLDKAAEIYSYMTEGFPIICYYYPADVLTAMVSAAMP